MKTIRHFIACIIITGSISTTVTAQCNYTVGDNDISSSISTPIVIDGFMSNWTSILSDLDIIAPQQSTSPVSLLSFQATLRDKNATLDWTTTNHFNFSHFVIEKSTDARSFTEAAILFADATTSNAEYSYKYKHNLQNSKAKIVYYRLKMVDVNGTFTYSETRMVRLSTEQTKVLINPFPNPVANELRVQIPIDWQDKAVTYEIFNSSGLLLQRLLIKNAAQVQSLQIQELNSGTYILKVSSDTASTTSKFIKY